MGQRWPGPRIKREARTRRAMFAGAMAAFVAAFGLVSMSAPPPAPAAVVAAPAAPVATERAVVAFQPRQEAFVPAEPQVRPERKRAPRPVHARTQSS